MSAEPCGYCGRPSARRYRLWPDQEERGHLECQRFVRACPEAAEIGMKVRREALDQFAHGRLRGECERAPEPEGDPFDLPDLKLGGRWYGGDYARTVR